MLKSADVMACGLAPVAKSIPVLNEPVPVPRRTVVVAELLLATAASTLPSLLKSPTTTYVGTIPTWKSVLLPNEPVPVPRRMESAFPLTTAISALPSSLKSAVVA